MFFKLPWFNKSKDAKYSDTLVLELDFLVDEFHDAMADIQDPLRTRLHAALISAQTPKDLWFLRQAVQPHRQTPLRIRGARTRGQARPEAAVLRGSPPRPFARRAALRTDGSAALSPISLLVCLIGPSM